MDRFFAKIVSPKRALIEKDLKHLKVKRTRIGDLIEVLDEETFEPFLGKLVSVSKKGAEVELIKPLEVKKPKFFVRLYQCVPVSISTFDEIVEKSTEIGVSEIVPVISKRSYQKWSVVEEKIPRWERIAKETLKQCGRHIPPLIGKPQKLEDLKAEKNFLNLFPFELEGKKKLVEVLKNSNTPMGVNIVIGPEGGFSEGEAKLLTERGFIPVSLGEFILKAETAAIAAAFFVFHYFS
jgi:16S rRNA (uracil1498-N3)-methyltransferase